MMSEGGPYTLTCSDGTKTVSFSDVMIGDVWYASGQSNMDWPMKRDADWKTEGPKADNYPNIRLLNRTGNPYGGGGKWSMDQIKNLTVEDFYSGSWEVGSQAAVKDMSAVAYYFAQQIHLATGAAVGIVLDALPARTFHGRIETVSDSGSKRQEWGDAVYFEGVVAFEQHEPRGLLPGMSVLVEQHP